MLMCTWVLYLKAEICDHAYKLHWMETFTLDFQAVFMEILSDLFMVLKLHQRYLVILVKII